MSLGDKISLYMNQIDLIGVIALKNTDLKLTIMQLKGAEEEKDRLELYLKTTIDERNALREEVEKLKKVLQENEEATKEKDLLLGEKELEIGRLEGKLQGMEYSQGLFKNIAGQRIKKVVDQGVQYFEKDQAGKQDKQGA